MIDRNDDRKRKERGRKVTNRPERFPKLERKRKKGNQPARKGSRNSRERGRKVTNRLERFPKHERKRKKGNQSPGKVPETREKEEER
jgi:hypothetical protein